MFRQELDTYDPSFEMPPDNFGYIRSVIEHLTRDSIFKCQDCQKVSRRLMFTRKERQKVEDTLKKTFFGYDGPLDSSALGSKELVLNYNSE